MLHELVADKLVHQLVADKLSHELVADKLLHELVAEKHCTSWLLLSPPRSLDSPYVLIGTIFYSSLLVLLCPPERPLGGALGGYTRLYADADADDEDDADQVRYTSDDDTGSFEAFARRFMW